MCVAERIGFEVDPALVNPAMKPHCRAIVPWLLASAGAPFFFKQWGEWAPYDRSSVNGALVATPNSLETPMQKCGKNLSGRLLDGVEHNGFPEPAHV